MKNIVMVEKDRFLLFQKDALSAIGTTNLKALTKSVTLIRVVEVLI